MTNHEKISETTSRPDGAGGVLLGRPTFAENTGTIVNSTLVRAFNAASISEAEWLASC
jgi:hypothetical protein